MQFICWSVFWTSIFPLTNMVYQHQRTAMYRQPGRGGSGEGDDLGRARRHGDLAVWQHHDPAVRRRHDMASAQYRSAIVT